MLLRFIEEQDIKYSLKNNWYNFRGAPDWAKQRRKLVKLAVQNNGENLQFAAEKFKDDEEIVRLAVSKSPYAIQYCSLEMRQNKEIMKLAITKNGYMFMFASPELKSDVELIKLALTNDESAAKHISKEAMKKQKFVLSILPELEPTYIPREFIIKKKFLMKAFQFNVDIFHQIPKGHALRKDKAVRYECYKNIYDFTKELKDWETVSEEEIIEFLIKQNANENAKLFRFVDSSVKLDKNFIIKLIHENKCGVIYLKLIDHFLFNDFDIIKAAIEHSPEIIKEIRVLNAHVRNKEIAFIGLQTNPTLISYYPNSIRRDVDVGKFVLEIDPKTFYLLSKKLKRDKDFLIFAILHGLEFDHSRLSSAGFLHDKDILLAYVKQSNGNVLQNKKFPSTFKTDVEFAKMVFYEIDSYSGDYFSDEVRFEATCQYKKSAKK